VVLKRLLRLGKRGSEGRGGESAWLPDAELVDGHRPPDAQGLSSQLLGVARQLLEADGAVVLRRTDEGWQVTLASPGFNPRRNIPRVEGLLALAWDGEKEITAASVHPAAVGYFPAEKGSVSLCLVPLTHRGRLRALLACHRASGRPFLEKDIGLLKRCARLLDGWESYAAHAQALSAVRDQEERLARGLEKMLGESDPLEMGGFALDALFDLLPAVYGFSVIQSGWANYSSVFTKRFSSPEHFKHPERNTWCYWVMSRGREPIYLDGAASRDTAMPLLYEGEPFPPGAVAFIHPLESGGELFGAVGLVGKPEDVFPVPEREAAGRFLRQVSALMTVALLNRVHRENAIMDALTGLFNRRYFDERLVTEVSRSQRDGKPLSLVLIDLDHFKRINDSYGHPAGDATLREVAQRVRTAVRNVDVVCRYGGEEIAIILPACGLQEAVDVAERARRSVEAAPTGEATGLPEPITLSAGVASCPVPNPTPSGLTKSADGALYEAKRKGRNRVEVAKR
jgi:diguanylate cyclase (GGDEF)-like protein